MLHISLPETAPHRPKTYELNGPRRHPEMENA
jgi:hypothetical protein